jgi:hypothetical protein
VHLAVQPDGALLRQRHLLEFLVYFAQALAYVGMGVGVIDLVRGLANNLFG